MAEQAGDIVTGRSAYSKKHLYGTSRISFISIDVSLSDVQLHRRNWFI